MWWGLWLPLLSAHVLAPLAKLFPACLWCIPVWFSSRKAVWRALMCRCGSTVDVRREKQELMEDKQHKKNELLTLCHVVGLCNSSWTHCPGKPRKLTFNSKRKSALQCFPTSSTATWVLPVVSTLFFWFSHRNHSWLGLSICSFFHC